MKKKIELLKLKPIEKTINVTDEVYRAQITDAYNCFIRQNNFSLSKSEEEACRALYVDIYNRFTTEKIK